MKAKYVKFTLLEILSNIIYIRNNIVTNITLSLLVYEAAQPDVENHTKYFKTIQSEVFFLVDILKNYD